MIKQKIKSYLEDLFNISISSNKRSIAAMTSPEEREFFASSSRKMADRAGDIVDLGTWMGASAASFAEGLRRKHGTIHSDSGKIYTIDRFIWEESMNVNYVDKDLIADYKAGESFLPEVRKNLKPYHSVIELIQADLSTYEWNGKGIKILHVDAMKSPELCSSIANVFFPYLQKDSLLIHQDFKHWYTPMIHVLQFRLREFFSFYHEVKTGGTVAFKTRKEIPPKVLKKATDFSSLDEMEIQTIFDYSHSLVDEKSHPKIAAAHIMHFIKTGFIPKAQTLLEFYEKKGYSASNDIQNVKSYLLNAK